MNNPTCVRCQDREGIVYVNKLLTCRQCANKFHKAKSYFTKHQGVTSTNSSPRSWIPTFINQDGKPQYKISTPTHIQTQP